MYLLILNDEGEVELKTLSFTFHYVSINMDAEKDVIAQFERFTFHYVSINI